MAVQVLGAQVHVLNSGLSSHGLVIQNARNDTFNRKEMKRFLSSITEGSPVKLRAIHLMYPDMKAEGKLFLPFILSIMGKELRQRTLIHCGCPNEVVMDLQEYGLQKAGIPTCLGGEYTEQDFLDWLLRNRNLDLARPARHLAIVDPPVPVHRTHAIARVA